MTGYGQSSLSQDLLSVSVEMRSVNHRFFDCHIRIPQQMIILEEKIKKMIRQHIARGRIDCFIAIDGENLTKKHLNIDWNLIDEYYQFITSLKERYQLEEDINVQHFIHNKELLSVGEEKTANEDLENLILKAVEESVQQLIEMRMIEGRELEKDLNGNVLQLEKELMDVEQLCPRGTKHYEERIRNKMIELTNGMINEDRIITEVAIMSERVDIAEEISRLKSHIHQFRIILKEKEPVGRKLDFLIQEMNREVNTIGSKSLDSEISKKVVLLKSLIEKLREQVQNIE